MKRAILVLILVAGSILPSILSLNSSTGNRTISKGPGVRVSQTSMTAPNATIAIQPNATADLSRTMNQITVELVLNNTPEVPPFNGINVELSYDPHVLSASNLDYSTNVFTQTTFSSLVVRDCLDGLPANNGPNSLCGPDDGLGRTSFAETILGGSTPSGTQGDIFRLVFKVNTTAPNFSQIQIAQGILSLGSTPIPTTNVDGYYSSLSCGGLVCPLARPIFSWSPKPVVQGVLAMFDSSSSVPSPGAVITDHFWTFGDSYSLRPYRDSGTNSTTAYIFQVAGNYSVTLKITDSKGVIAFKTQVVMVVSQQTGDFEIGASPMSLIIQKSGGIDDPFAIAFSNVTLKSLNGFSGNVLLGPGFPTPLGLTFSPSAVGLSAISTAISRLTVSAANLSPGTYFANVTGTQLLVNGSVGPLHHSVGITVQVISPPPDFQIFLGLFFGRSIVFAGSSTSVGISLSSPQLFNGTVTLTGRVNPKVANGPVLSFNPSQVTISFGSGFSELAISTSQLTPPENYTVTITATSGSIIHTALFPLIILPPPIITLNPPNGFVGTLVQVRGSGFANLVPRPLASPVEISLTFDDQFVGFTLTPNGTFTFSFNTPEAQSGTHMVKASEQLFGSGDSETIATADFDILPSPSLIVVNGGSGAVYFPGDTAQIFVQTTLNGHSVSVASLQVILVRPDGTNISLSALPLSPGTYKASYPIPLTGSLGIYGVIVKAHQTGAIDGSLLESFSVKQTWLHANGRNIATSIGLVGMAGMLGIVGLAWKKERFKRRED